VDPVVERTAAEIPVGQTGPPLVEGDDPPQRAQPLREPPEGWQLEGQLAMPNRAGHHDDRSLALTPLAIGDAETITGRGTTDRSEIHALILPHTRGAWVLYPLSARRRSRGGRTGCGAGGGRGGAGGL